jgi:hypothetical protein
VALSADGTRLVASQRFGGIHTSAGAESPLQPGATYHYQLVGINGAGIARGNDLKFFPGAIAIGGPTRAGTNLIFNVAGGTPGGGWTLLTATNFNLPIQWRTNRTGTFDASGGARLTNATLSVEPRRFFTIRAP